MTRVIVTRASPDGEAFAALCRAQGLEPILSPVMKIDIDQTDIDLEGVGAIAFTSANGVRAFAANSEMRNLPVFVVGEVTASAAREAGFKDIHAAGGDVASLADHIVSEIGVSQKSVLHIAGEDRAGDLVAMLSDRNTRARRLTLYRAAALSALPEAAKAALKGENSGLWVSLFSPRTARLFVELVRKEGLEARLGECRAACLSEPVAAEARKARWAAVEISAARDGGSLLRLIETRA